MKLNELTEKLNGLLNVDYFAGVDFSLNGLQVGDTKKNPDVKKIAFAVDACQASIDAAVKEEADVLIVHHGLFWGRPIAVSGSHFSRIKALLDAGISLYACHLPLDAHPELGHNARMAKALGLTDVRPFGEFKGRFIGFIGRLPEPLSARQICTRLGLNYAGGEKLLFGKELNETVALISGGGTHDLDAAISCGADLYITGDRNHVCYHTCAENSMNMLSLGHYDTEVFGMRALMEVLEQWDLDVEFLDIPTGM